MDGCCRNSDLGSHDPLGTISANGEVAREVSVSVGLGHVFVYEAETVGNRLNIGGGLGIMHRSGFGVEFEVNRTLGFSPGLAQCAIEGTFCYGTTHAGIRPPTVASASLQYRFTRRRIAHGCNLRSMPHI